MQIIGAWLETVCILVSFIVKIVVCAVDQLIKAQMQHTVEIYTTVLMYPHLVCLNSFQSKLFRLLFFLT